MILIAHTDPELLEWLLGIAHNKPVRAGDFLHALAEAGLRADEENYAAPGFAQDEGKISQKGKGFYENLSIDVGPGSGWCHNGAIQGLQETSGMDPGGLRERGQKEIVRRDDAGDGGRRKTSFLRAGPPSRAPGGPRRAFVRLHDPMGPFGARPHLALHAAFQICRWASRGLFL